MYLMNDNNDTKTQLVVNKSNIIYKIVIKLSVIFSFHIEELHKDPDITITRYAFWNISFPSVGKQITLIYKMKQKAKVNQFTVNNYEYTCIYINEHMLKGMYVHVHVNTGIDILSLF